MRTPNCAAELSGGAVAEVVLATSSHAALAALAEAQTLLREHGAESAVDRIHTGLHGYLRAACDAAGIMYHNDPTANQLLRALTEQHPNLANLGARGEDVKRTIRTSGAILDALGTIRNNASRAHPNEEVLGSDEAHLVINLTRSLLHYLDAKFR